NEYEEFFPDQDVWWSHGGIPSWTSAEYDDEIIYLNVENIYSSHFYEINDEIYEVYTKRFSDEDEYEDRWFVENLGIVKVKIYEEEGVSSIIQLEDVNIENETTNFFPLAVGNHWQYSTLEAPMYPSDLWYESVVVPDEPSTQIVYFSWDPPYVNSEEDIIWEGYHIYEDNELIGEVPFGTNEFGANYRESWRELREYFVTAYNGDFESESSNIVIVDIVSNQEETVCENKPTTSNYPNPFNPQTTISYNLLNGAKVNITVFNIKGQEVKNLVDKEMQRGNYSVVWRGEDEQGKIVSSGVYFYKLNVNGKTEVVRKCLLLK
ncbi:MAG: T9SS type A sorting domain-containing protein, partial [Candidatus Cloacimonadota bacterium]|nr:T9SS type A sorting domain-containing protein [Candidatus Cloacimonadota bacterium]